MESTAFDNVVYIDNNGILKVHTRLRVQQYILLSSSRRVQAVQTCSVERTQGGKSTAVDNVVCSGDNGIFRVHTRLRVQHYILLSSSRRVQAVQTC